MEVKIKKLTGDAVIPVYSSKGCAGMDMTAISMDETSDYIEYGTGIAIEVPEGYVGLIYPRSSISKYELLLTNSVGVIDPFYTGEIRFRFKRTKQRTPNGVLGGESALFCSKVKKYNGKIYEIGDRIGQLIIMPFPHVDFTEVDELSDSERGSGGFGSTGK